MSEPTARATATRRTATARHGDGEADDRRTTMLATTGTQARRGALRAGRRHRHAGREERAVRRDRPPARRAPRPGAAAGSSPCWCSSVGSVRARRARPAAARRTRPNIIVEGVDQPRRHRLRRAAPPAAGRPRHVPRRRGRSPTRRRTSSPASSSARCTALRESVEHKLNRLPLKLHRQPAPRRPAEPGHQRHRQPRPEPAADDHADPHVDPHDDRRDDHDVHRSRRCWR